MMKVVTLVVLLVVIVATSNAQSSMDKFESSIPREKRFDLIHKFKRVNETQRRRRKPAFCGNRDCPYYDVMEKGPDYEVRCYEGALWVSAEGIGYPTPIGGVTSQMLNGLLDYISGANSMGASMDMTVPVLVGAKMEQGRKMQKMSIYIPEIFQYPNPTPKPKDRRIFLEGKEFCAYVRSFPGTQVAFMQYQLQVQILKTSLWRDGFGNAYIKDLMYYANYDPPSKLYNRYNEVMLIST